MKQKILFIYRHDALNNIIKPNGEIFGPTEFLWGMNFIDRDKYDVAYINCPQRMERQGKLKLFKFFENIFARMVKIGLPIEIYPLFKKEISEADIIICSNDQISLGVLFWRLLGKLKKQKIYCIIMSLQERIKYFRWNKPIIQFISKLLNKADGVFTLSHAVVPDFIKDYQIKPANIFTLYFGIDADFWRPAPVSERKNFVLSVGNDMNRDYDTLVDALPVGVKLKIVTSKKIDIKNKDIEIISGISNERLRELYSEAEIVVIPSIKLKNESAGLSSTLQAMACKTSVIVSDAPPLREMFEDGKDCLFYNPEDSADLRIKLEELLHNEILCSIMANNAFEKINRKFVNKNMALVIERAIA